MENQCAHCRNIIPEGDLQFKVNGITFCSADCALDADIVNAAIEVAFSRPDNSTVTVLMSSEKDGTWSKLCTTESPEDRFVFGAVSKVDYATARRAFDKEIARLARV